MNFLFLWLLTTVTLVSAIKLPFRRLQNSNLHRRSTAVSILHTLAAAQDNVTEVSLSTSEDIIYMTNLTVGGNPYTVQLDTGSSDLWLKGPTTPIPNSNPTSTIFNLTYGIGWAQGHLSFAAVDFADITVPNQAFLDASVVQNPALVYGAVGILGLGFTSLSSLDALVNATGSSAGRSLLYNLFNANPQEPNFISFSLQRSLEPGDDVEGSFAIGEYEPAYAAVANNAPISTWPVSFPKRWTVLVDALLTNGTAFTPSTSVPDAPSNRAVALIDSGTSWSYASEDICNAIYANIPGATFNSQLSQWIVPCDAEVDIAFQIGGQVFPVHPLDVTPKSLNDPTTCVGSFVPQSVAIGNGQFDWILGDNFLRAVYSVYDFGDFDANHNMGNPYLKFLSLVDPDAASSEFATLRNTTAKTGITYNASNVTASDSNSGSTSVTLSDDLANTLNKIGVYLPAMLGIMALNALVLAILIVGGVVYLCRRRSKRSRNARIRTPNGRLTPMPRNSYIAGSPSPDQHAYEPISMAITEDTMLNNPSSPIFPKFDGRLGDRPQSLATLPSQSKLYQQIGSEDALVPPSPSFLKGNDRPKSVGMPPSTQPNFISSARQDEPFTSPSAAQSMDNVSLRSGRSGISLVEDGSAPQIIPLMPPPSGRPANVMIADEPHSVVTPSPLVQSPEDVLMPPSPGFSVGFSSSDRLKSTGLSTTQAPTYPPPPSPKSASPRFQTSSTLQPNAPFPADRPMSVGMLPYQTQGGDPRLIHPSPPFNRQGSSLRPGSGLERPVGAMLPPGIQSVLLEEDITTFTPPAPAFRRSPSGRSSENRPMSMA